MLVVKESYDKKSSDLWKEIIQKRNFDEKDYDKNEANIISECLKIEKYKIIYLGLKYKNISIEDFIKAFFEANSSFTVMM